MLRTKDLEKTVGRSLMGVFGSVLIFISLILFATLLLPYFNDVAKMITTFVLSFAFTGFGLWKLQKDKENKFYIAVTGCGIGAVYISLLLSNFYFKMVGDIALYVLIAMLAGMVYIEMHSGEVLHLLVLLTALATFMVMRRTFWRNGIICLQEYM